MSTGVGGAASLRRYKPYPEYKDSGVEWLGQVPAHWGVDRLKNAASVRFSNVDKHSLEGEERVQLCNYTDVYYNDEIQEDLPFMEATASPGEVQRFGLRKGDVLITKDSESWDDIAVPTHVAGDMGGVLCGYHLAMIRPDSRVLNGSYLARAFASAGIREQFKVSATGITRYGLSNASISDALFSVPPLAEQKAIAAFLDRETVKIDALIAKKERLIELLREKRTALITQAVTKGLDPNAPMKDSGVAWLCEVPAHWDAERIKWVARMDSGHTPDKKIADYWEGGDIPWVSLADTKRLREGDYIAETTTSTTAAGLAHSSAHLLPPDSVLFSRDATIGLCAVTVGEMAVSQHFIAWVCGERLQPKYLLFVLRTMTQELERLTMGATVKTIGMPDVKELVTPVPPLEEQSAIAQEVLEGRERINKLIKTVTDGADHLRELRIALISAAVTGKIDVREEVA